MIAQAGEGMRPAWSSFLTFSWSTKINWAVYEIKAIKKFYLSISNRIISM